MSSRDSHLLGGDGTNANDLRLGRACTKSSFRKDILVVVCRTDSVEGEGLRGLWSWASYEPEAGKEQQEWKGRGDRRNIEKEGIETPGDTQ